MQLVIKMSCQKAQLLKIERKRIRVGTRICEEKNIKLWNPQELVDHAFSNFERVAISCSFGKDSMVILHLALQKDPNVIVLFANTGVEFPDLIKYKNKIVSEWNLNLIEIKPKKTFWECVEQYGWPQIRNPKTRVPKCCYYLKKKPIVRLYKECGCDIVLDGLRAGESRMRFLAAVHKGQLFNSNWHKVWRAHPILWSDRNMIDSYLETHNIPKNPIYARGQLRTGCWVCTAFKNWDKILAQSYPKLYRILQKKRGQPLIEQFT